MLELVRRARPAGAARPRTRAGAAAAPARAGRAVASRARVRETSSGRSSRPRQRSEKNWSPLARPMMAQALRGRQRAAAAAAGDQPALEAGAVDPQRAVLVIVCGRRRRPGRPSGPARRRACGRGREASPPRRPRRRCRPRAASGPRRKPAAWSPARPSVLTGTVAGRGSHTSRDDAATMVDCGHRITHNTTAHRRE